MKNPVTLPIIERFLLITGWGPSRFGRAAIGDARLVTDLRAGREMQPNMEERVRRFMLDHVEAERAKMRRLNQLVR